MTTVHHNTRLVLVALLMLVTALLPLYAQSTVNPAPRLDHIGLLVRSTPETAQFLISVMGFRLNPVKWQVSKNTQQSGGLNLGFVDGAGMQFTLIEPTSPGPVLNDLQEKGNGTYYELDFEVPDFDVALDGLEAARVSVVNMDGKPFPPGQRGWRVEPYGLRLMYLPQNLSQHITIEIYQRGPDSHDILNRRDEGWKTAAPSAPEALRLSHIVIVVDDLAKSAAFLVDTMKLHRIEDPVDRMPQPAVAKEFECALLADSAGTRIELVQPRTSLSGTRLLAIKGTGYVAELVYTASDFGGFMRRMKEKQLQMIDATGSSEGVRITGCIAARQPSAGAVSFPLDVSHGLRLTVIDGQ